MTGKLKNKVVLITGAGKGAGRAQPRVSLLDMDEWDWHRMLDVNLTGRPNSSVEKSAAYLAGKAGLAELSRQADGELNPYGIRVHAVENTSNVVDDVISILEA